MIENLPMEITWIKNRMPEEDSNLLVNECNNTKRIKNYTVNVLVFTKNGKIYQTKRVKPNMHWEKQPDGDYCRISSDNESWRWDEEYNCYDVHDVAKNTSGIIAWAYNITAIE